MNDFFTDGLIYIYLAIILYYFISAILEPFENGKIWKKWLAIGVVILLILFVAWWFWSERKTEDSNKIKVKDEFEEFEESEEESEIEFDDDDVNVSSSKKSSRSWMKEKGSVANIPDKYSRQKRDFALLDEVITEDDVMTYEYFKRWYLSPEFLQKYTEAMKGALKIKKEKLMSVRKQYKEDLATIRSKAKPKNDLANIFNNLDNKTDDRQILETTIAEFESLLREIKIRERKISIDFTRKCLVSALNNPRHGLESLTGRTAIKDFLALQLYTFAQNPRIFFANFQNKAIYGPSGVGKTKLAQVIGHVYASSGILLRNHVHVITKQSLTTAYVNETPKITRKLLLSNLESIVFIDEAYDLTPPADLMGRSIDHGREAITEIVNFLDKMMGLSILIVAGYEKEMEDRFMNANEGLPRRFPHKLILPKYNSSELTSILMKFLMETCPDIHFEKDCIDYLYTLLDHIYKDNPEIFKNQAGDMSNLSGFISRAIYGTLGKKWPQQSEQILTSGMNSYLAQKGRTIEILE